MFGVDKVIYRHYLIVVIKMPNAYILARFSHGNEPIFIAMNMAAHLMRSDPNLDLVLPAPRSKAGLIREIADGRGN